MTKVNKSSSINGKWLDKKTLETGDLIKIVTEASEQPNPQGDGVQLVAKVKVKDKTREPENLAINVPSKNALIDAFGDDTSAWVDKVLTANVEKVLVGGKRGIALYLVPDGMVLKESDDGYMYIGHPESESGTVKHPISEERGGVDYPDEQIDPKDIPF